MLKDYLFSYESDNGEVDFLVECETRGEAWEIAKKNFPTENGEGCLWLLEEMTPEEGEFLGLDTF